MLMIWIKNRIYFMITKISRLLEDLQKKNLKNFIVNLIMKKINFKILNYKKIKNKNFQVLKHYYYYKIIQIHLHL